MNKLPKSKDSILFTPGPLTTSATVKQAMLRDLGSRDAEFINVVKEIRNELLKLGNVTKGEYEAILMQGSGTSGIESVITSTMTDNDCMLIIINGAYGHRIAKIAKIHKLNTIELEFPENEIPDIETVEETLKKHENITHMTVVHCETTTGILNPIKEIGQLAKAYNKVYFVDSMSAYGAIPTDLKESNIDYLVSSANKNIEGIPGFSYILARTEELMKCKDISRTLTLNLYAQWEGLEKNGQFRFTPPIQSMLAFHQALQELKMEGGVAARYQRYKNNHKILNDGMRELGFKEYIKPELQAPIISTYYNPEHPNYDFEKMYQLFNDAGIVIYPGKTTKAECFRIGSIGRVFEEDIHFLLDTMKRIMIKMDLNI